MRVELFIEYHSHRTMLIIRVKIRLPYCFGWNISSNLTTYRFGRDITAVVKLALVE